MGSLQQTCYRRRMALPLPQKLDLPLFAYGLFQPGELCHRRVEPLLASPPTCDHVSGILFVRDGLPFVSLAPQHAGIAGSVLHFRPESQRPAYEDIATFEPERLYRWDRIVTLDHIEVNILVARMPARDTRKLSKVAGGHIATIQFFERGCKLWKTVCETLAMSLSAERRRQALTGPDSSVCRWHTCSSGQQLNGTPHSPSARPLTPWTGSNAWARSISFKWRCAPACRAPTLSPIPEILTNTDWILSLR